ncbi:AAA family ATPase [Azospirillum sp. RWY-5-1]|nr:AAA family ATPase [Azospirillum oleiclasticum]
MRLLLGGTDILMLAPRRIGKTWLMKKVDGDLTAAGVTCVRIDVEGIDSEAAFLRTLCQEIDGKQTIVGSVTNFLTTKLKQARSGNAGSSLAEMLGTTDPRIFSDTLIAALHQQGTRTVIMIDEFSLFVWGLSRKDPDGARTMLYHLRRLQQEHTNVSWLLTGSIGLDVVARRLGLEGALLDFENFGLAPFDEGAARSYLSEQSNDGLLDQPYDLTDDGFAHLTRELGWLSPYYLGHIARLVKPAAPTQAGGRASAGRVEVERAFEALLSPLHRSYFAPWGEHIRKNFLPEDTGRLEMILARCCETAGGETEDTLLGLFNPTPGAVSLRDLKDLLLSLCNDGYLVKDDGRWRYRSGLLRRYWLEYVA